MKARPHSVTIISILAMVVGAGGFASHASKFDLANLLGAIALCALSLAAVIAGIFMLRGSNWARWLWLVWMALHVAISFFNTIAEVLVHAAMFVVVAFLLFRPTVSAYFQGTVVVPLPAPNPGEAGNRSEPQ